MRIARVLTRLNLGGPARQVLASDPLLLARGHEVRVLAGSPEAGEGDLFDELRARGVDVVRIPGLRRGPRPAGDLRAYRALRAELAAFAPDLVHTHASKAGLLGRAAARGLPAARVHTFHGHVLEGYFPRPVAAALAALERCLARGTARVVAVSHATADDLVRLRVVDESRLVVVPPGIELAALTAVEGRSGRVRERLGIGPDAFVVGVLGRLAAVKQPLVAVDVFERLAEHRPELELVFVGDGGERRALERRVERGSTAVRRRVHLLGAEPDVAGVLADLDAVLLTSRSEGAPVALIEAAAAAKPVVARPVGGVAEIVAHERTGWLGEDADALAFGLDQLLERPEEARAMGRRGRLRVAARHSAEALAKRLEDLYRVVLEERRCDS